MQLILASTSPRRREILALLGLPFAVMAPEFDELSLPERPVADEVLCFALGKARSVAEHFPQAIVIGSDTMILLEAVKIGKPEGREEAKRILRALSGRTHRIFTGVVILDGPRGPRLRTVEEVSVTMRNYSGADIDRYLAYSESLDKAGAYSIQGEGRALIESVEGDYLAAVGMPLRGIANYLHSRGVELPVDIDKLYSEKAFPNWRSF
jgi:septum formation protein